jgi:hypothetical protein
MSWTKLREEIDFLETGCFRPKAIPWRLANLKPWQKNYLYGVGLILKIPSRSLLSIKSYSRFQHGETQIQKHICMPSHIHIQLGKIFNALLILFNLLCS